MYKTQIIEYDIVKKTISEQIFSNEKELKIKNSKINELNNIVCVNNNN